MAMIMDTGGIDLGQVENEEVLTLLECPVCLDHITPPVKQCVKGHLVCNECFPRLPHCPTCRSPMNQERNLAVEQIGMYVQASCVSFYHIYENSTPSEVNLCLGTSLLARLYVELVLNEEC